MEVVLALSVPLILLILYVCSKDLIALAFAVRSKPVEEPDEGEEHKEPAIVVYGPWVARKHCVDCDQFLDERTVYRSGVCPYCGHNSGLTMCDVVQKAARLVKQGVSSHWEYKSPCTKKT